MRHDKQMKISREGMFVGMDVAFCAPINKQK